MEFGLLGTLKIQDGALPPGRHKERALLALLLLAANRVVPRDELIDKLWGDDPPNQVVKTLQVYVSQLRKLLPALALRTRQPGYVLEVDPDALDVLRFERLVAAARGAEPARASHLLAEALGLWRGPALVEFDEPFARVEAARLDELRLSALEERVEAELALGHDAGLVAELEAVVAEHPHRERLRGQLMLALYRGGRQADALAAFRDAREALDEFGLEPNAGLRQLERRILLQDASLERTRVALPGPLVPAPAFPFVGRSGELVALRAALDRAERSQGGLVLLGAEAGGGKTRLARELALEAAARGLLVLYGVSDAVVSTPYQPLREWFEFLARTLEPDVLEACLGERRELVARLVPELARDPAARSQLDRHSLHGALCEVLRRVSQRRPIVLVADDLHWADAGMLQLLRRLAATAPEAGMLVVATYRDRGEKPRPAFEEALAELTRLDGSLRISLSPFTAEEVGAFIDASSDAEVAETLAAEIAGLTGGAPLLLCELWQSLRESGAVDISDGDVRLSQPLAELRGPERLRDVVRHRLSRLTPETAATLELAAVSGPRIELRVLARIAGRERSALALEEASTHGLLEEVPGTVPTCRFTHELVRRAVYDRITGIRRAELHLRIGEELEHIHAADPTAALPELAHHFTLAVVVAGPQRAVDYNLRAGAAAVGASAFEEGAARLTTALELGIDDPHDRARTRVELAHLLSEMGRLGESEAMLAASLDSATGLKERGIVARALVYNMSNRLADPELDLDEMHAVAKAARETFRQLDDTRGLAVAGRYLSIALTRKGRAAEALIAAEEALVHAKQSGDEEVRRAIVSTIASSLCHGPTPVPEALRRCESLLKSSAGDRVLEAVVTRNLAFLTAMDGRGDEALELVQTSSRLLDELDYLTLTRVHRVVAGEARALAGDRAGAEQEFREAWLGFRESASYAIDERAMHAAGHLAELCCDEGRWDDAAELIDYGRELPLAETTATALRRLCVKARLAAHDGRLDEALALARHAVACAEPSDQLNRKAGVHVALGEVQRAAESPAEATAAVEEAIRLYEAKGNVAASCQARERGALIP